MAWSTKEEKRFNDLSNKVDITKSEVDKLNAYNHANHYRLMRIEVALWGGVVVALGALITFLLTK